MNLTTGREKANRQNAAFKNLMLLHWLMAAFTLSLYITGVFVAYPRQSPLLTWVIPFLHQSFGMLFLMLLIARMVLLLRLVGLRYWRRSPKVTSNWLQTIILHSSLYFFMLVAPMSGFFLRNSIGLDTTFFGIDVPLLFNVNENWVELARSSHFWSSYIFMAFIFLHVLTYWKIVWMNVRKCFIYLPKAFFKKKT